MTLYMTQLAVADVAASVAWYRDLLGLRVERFDAANGFALLQADGGARLALKAGTPVPGGVTVHFQVAALAVELARLEAAGVAVTASVKGSPEGYRRAVVADPDGYAVVLFEWAG